jgi:hypothetical protein
VTRTARRLLPLAAALALSLDAAAAERIVPLTGGESLEALARYYYGSSGMAPFLASHNGMQGEELPEGSLRVPYADEHVTQGEETWDDLASRFWGDGSLGEALAALNGEPGDSAPGMGTRIRVPMLVAYAVRPGESLAALSRRLYGSPSLGSLLGRINGVDDPKLLFVGRRLRVPISHLDEGKPPPIPAPAALRRKTLTPGPPLRDRLRAALGEYVGGDYDLALDHLEALRGEVMKAGSPSERAQLLRHLTFVYVAWDRPGDACESYRALVTLDPATRFDPDRVSPKIRRVVSACEGG